VRVRVLTFRYVGALLVVAGLLVAGQTVIHQVLSRQEGNARVINLAGRQRMLGQRLCTLLLALDVDGNDPAHGIRDELARTADDWAVSQAALRAGRPEAGLHTTNPDVVHGLFAQIDADHHAMLAAAHAALALPLGTIAPEHARTACTHQEAFLTGMDHIVTEYEHQARQQIVGLRRLELVLLALALLVLLLEGVFVFRPAVRGLRLQLAEHDLVQHALDASEAEKQALAIRDIAEIARLERQLLQVSDREQMQLAQELHDGLAQHLIGVAFLLRPLRKELGSGPWTKRLDEVSRLLDEAIDQTRHLARSRHSPALEGAGLATALGELAAYTTRVFGVACDVHDRAGFDPPVASSTHLHRIAREAVINAAKHASATTIEIELACDAGELTLVVRDDGVGIGPRPAAGMGLQFMTYRARMLGASLQIAPGQGRGTTVTCRVPLRELVARGARS
jgi:signal transduction histidine kinase